MDNLSSNEINMILQALVDKEMGISGILQRLEENKKDIQNHGLKEFIQKREDEYKEELKCLKGLYEKVINIQLKNK